MIPLTSSPKLARFYHFFETFGTARLNGLDESYFLDLDESEKSEAWDFLVKSGLSKETLDGLCLLNRERAIGLIKDALASPMEISPYSAEQREVEALRLSMLKYLSDVSPAEEYIAAMCEFAKSKFEEVRAVFAQVLPTQKTTHEAVEALKAMIFTEVERVALTSAITKLMLIHGLEFDRNDPLYKSLYVALNSDDPQKKFAAMNKLEKIGRPIYF